MPPATLPPLEERFTDYAAIALATAAIEHGATAAPRSPGVKRAIQSLVEALWAWQAGPQESGHKEMSKDDARKLASFSFYSELAKLLALRDQHPGDSPDSALLSAIVDALTFIVWTMDGVERLLNWGKPTVVGDEIGDDGWDGLAKALDGLAASAPDPDAERTWQVQLVECVTRSHPGKIGEEILGRPVKRQELNTLRA
jgi:hypothetical protein